MKSEIPPSSNNSKSPVNSLSDNNLRKIFCDLDDFELLEVNESISGKIETLSQEDELGQKESNVSPYQQTTWLHFSYLLLRIGGWTVAVLLAFRLVIIPLLTAGNSPVALILASAVSAFLVLCAIAVVIRQLHR
jgi:hypothetical protein